MDDEELAWLGSVYAEVVEAVERLQVIESALSRLMAAWCESSYGEDVSPVPGSSRPITEREREVLDLLTQGMSNRLIARNLGIAEHTVKNHVQALFRKLNVTNRTEAALVVLRRGNPTAR